MAISAVEKSRIPVWREQAASYGWDVDKSLSATLKVSLIRRYLTPTAKVCDVGCANGLFIKTYARECAAVTGVDVSADMLAQCRQMATRERLSNVEVMESGAQSMPLPSDAFDLVCCYSTLQVVPDTDAALSEMSRLLRPGGVLLLEAQGRLHLGCLFWTAYYRFRGVRLRTFTRGQIAQRLSLHDLSVRKIIGVGATDQWRYVPLLRRARWLARMFHKSPQPAENLDFALSNTWVMKWFASSYFVVAQKNATAVPRS